jgi:hypothetical protein
MKVWMWILLIGLMLAAMFGEIILPHSSTTAWWSGVYFFWAIFGFVGCIVLIYFAKYIFKAIVQRKESYYDEL